MPPEEDSRAAHSRRLAHADERAGHPAGPADVHQPGARIGQLVLRSVTQHKAPHFADPRLDSAGYLRHADKCPESMRLGRLVRPRVRVQRHTAGKQDPTVLGERQAQASTQVSGIGLDEAVEQPWRLAEPVGLRRGEAPGQPAAVDVLEVQPRRGYQAPRQLVQNLAVTGQEPEAPEPAPT
jgi:hypothetical protein